MEQTAIQWLGAPSCLRGSFAFYKSVSCRSREGGSAGEWRLGEFYFVRCGPQEPVCVAEVTLLWEDRNRRHLLASSRLYFLPEDTPKGRTKDHGEDEVLAVSKKIVVRVEDLVRWTCPEPSQWKRNGLRNNGLHRPADTSPASVPLDEITENALQDVAQQKVTVLSYPQYCRFRSLQKRVQDRAGLTGLQDPHLLALGGVKVTQPNMTVLYCRDTFSHPTLDSNASVISQLGCSSLSLKGRPRRRRGRDSKGFEQPILNRSESLVETGKENVTGSTDTSWEGGWLPHPEEQLFLDQLFTFMECRGSPIHKVPNLGFKKIDLFVMYSVVKRLGGYEKVTAQRLWKTVYNELGGCPGSTSAATCTRRHYEKLMLPYEQHINGGSPEPGASRAPAAGANGRKVPRGREVENGQRKNGNADQQEPPTEVVVVRKRGRPPGKRKAKVITKGSVGRPSLRAKRDLNQTPRHPEPSAQSPPVPSEVDPSDLPSPVVLASMSSPSPEREVLPQEMTPPTSPMVTSSRQQDGGSLLGFSPTKGLCPLDLFRARLGLSQVVDSPGLTPHDPVALLQSILLSQPKTGSPETPDDLKHQCSGCDLEDPAHMGSSLDGRAPRPPLPPLRILPLDLNCSLQVRQLMRTRLGSAHMSSFTKRLSEALLQDLSKTQQPGGGVSSAVPQEQALPLNLSKRPSSKRPAEDDGYDGAELRETLPRQTVSSAPMLMTKRLKLEPEDLSLPMRRNRGSLGGMSLIQDEPADLSSPSRARAFLKDHQSSPVTTGPEGTCASLTPNQNLPSGNHTDISTVSEGSSSLREQRRDVSDDSDEKVVTLKSESDAKSSVKTETDSAAQGPSTTAELPNHPAQNVEHANGEPETVNSLKQLPGAIPPLPSQSC